MGIVKTSLFGGSSLGVYLCLNNKMLLYPRVTPKEKVKLFKEPFSNDFSSFPIMINQSALIGCYCVMNKNGLIVTDLITDSEAQKLSSYAKDHDMNYLELKSKDNAVGNLIMTNDKGAVISSYLRNNVKQIQNVLDVEVLILDYASTYLAGSGGITNNNGCCVHPMVSDNEADMISDVLKVPVDVSTVNMGDPFVHAGLVANDFGAIIGDQSSGPEMMRITNMLKL